MDTSPKYDLSFLNKISNGDKEFILEMVTTFKKTAPPAIEKMEEQLSAMNYQSMAREAHRFIPGISFLGVRYIEDDLLKIEDYAKKKENLDEIPGLLEEAKRKIYELIEVFNKDFELK